MESRATGGIGKRKKTLNACQWCRTRKIKCSGQQPCHYCASKGFECVFHERPKKVVVSEEYLNELERHTSGLIRQPQLSATQFNQRSARNPLHEQEVSGLNRTSQTSPQTPNRGLRSPNPLAQSFSEHQLYEIPSNDTRRQSKNLDHRERRQNADYQHQATDSANAIGDEYRRIGHSSSFSFSRHIRTMITEAVQGPDLHDLTPIKDGAYGVLWQKVAVDLSGLELPSEDYAEYLTHSLWFAFHPMYHLFDKKTFLCRLRQFYTDCNNENIEITGLWYIQMLVVFAFGQSILSREAGPQGPTGAPFFAKAVEALPDCHQLSQEPVLAIEILVLFSLFMQAMDMRLAAHQYIGQATRIAITHGLDRRWDPQRNTRQEFEHRSKLWWTIYVIDRKLSSLIGVVPGLLDEDISLPKPDIGGTSTEDCAMAFHVEIMSQLGHILNVVYGHGSQRELGSKFITAIQNVLQRLARTSKQLNMNMKIEKRGHTNSNSRTAASLYLLHHQCSILAIRPIIYFLLKKKLETRTSTLQLSDAVIALLRVCMESSLQTLNLIKFLQLHKLLDTLLPHDIDIMFAAAFILIVIDIISPSISVPWDIKSIMSLLDDYAAQGILIAGPYKQDLVEIDRLREDLEHHQRQGEESQHSQSQGEAANLPPMREDSLFGPQSNHSNHQTIISSLREESYWDSGPLNSDTIQCAIEGLDFDFLNDPSAAAANEKDWMW